MNENETSLYPVVEPSAFPITNRNQLESTMLRMQEDPPATTAQTMPTDVDVLELDGEFDYEEIADVPNMTLQAEAVEGAKQAQAAVILAGLPDRYETEGVDRTTLDLPANQVALIQAVAAVQPNTIVVLYNGAPVTMPWLTSPFCIHIISHRLYHVLCSYFYIILLFATGKSIDNGTSR